MKIFTINDTTTWQHLQKSLQETVEIEPLEKTLLERTITILNGHTPTTEKISQLIKQKITDTHQINDPHQVHTIFDQILRTSGTKYRDLVQLSAVQQIFKQVEQFENIEVRGTIPIREGVTWFYGGRPVDLQEEFLQLYTELFIKKPPENIEKLAEIYLNHLIAYIPFNELETGNLIQIPQKIESQWALISYAVEVLYLTPELIGGRVPAIGLLPEEGSKARPILIFRGTPLPNAQGALLSTISDFIPGYAVGELIYEHFSKEIIHNWVSRTHKKFGPLNLHGVSQGAIIALLTTCGHPDKINQVYAFNPPAPMSRALTLYEKNCAHLTTKPIVDLYEQEGDLVPKTGSGFHKDWNMHKIVSPIKQNLILSHTSLKITHRDVIVLKIDPEIENNRTSRRVFTVVHHAFSALLLPVSATLLSAATLATAGQKVYTLSRSYFQESSGRLLQWAFTSASNYKVVT